VQVLEERRVHHEVAVKAEILIIESGADSAVATLLGNLVTTLSLAVFAWLTVLGFTGGTVPGLGWQLPGGLLPGLAWLGVMSTLGVVAVLVAPLLAAAAVARVLTRARPAPR
jgi:hypothetical protein